MMVNDGFITQSEIEHVPSFPKDHVDYTAVIAYKSVYLRLPTSAFSRCKTGKITRHSAQSNPIGLMILLFYGAKGAFPRKPLD